MHFRVKLFALGIITGEALQTARGGGDGSRLGTKSGKTKTIQFVFFSLQE